MKGFLFYLLLFFSFSRSAIAQFLPAEGDTLNYRLTGFSVPPNPKAISYRFEISEGINNNEVFFHKNIIIKTISQQNNIIETLPAFGKAYTWRVVYLNKKGKEIAKNKLAHFHTGTSKYADTSKFRVNVIQQAIGYDSLYMFMDCTRTINDINGNPVWYLPNIAGIVTDNSTVRDLKLTPFSTITFLSDNKACEIDYNGNILWMAPNDGKVSGDTIEYYHHEFTRLSNGNYMVAGSNFEYRPIPEVNDSMLSKYGTVEKRGDKHYKKITFGTLIEYNAQKQIVWAWRSGDHFTNNDIFSRKTYRGYYTASTHMNSFFFDEKNKVIYTSYRDINRIVKISYPSGKELASYGESYAPEHHFDGNGWFASQHHCTVLSDGNLCIFNNNFHTGYPAEISEKMHSTVMILREPKVTGKSLEKLYEFPCNIDTFAKSLSTSGASVYELKTGALLTCMGTANRVFIVSRGEKILWNALYEMHSDGKWVSNSCYRISPIYHDSLYELTLKSH